MSKLTDFMESNSIVPKEKKKPSKAFDNLSTAEKWTLVKQLLLDLGYIDE